MKLDDQLVSLELSRKLKELGIKQESLFFFGHFCFMCFNNTENNYCNDCVKNAIKNPYWIEEGEYFNPECSAFSVAELGEMLPYEIHGTSLILTKLYSCWEIKYQEGDYPTERTFLRIVDDSLSTVMAKVLIYLIENKLVSVEDVNNV